MKENEKKKKKKEKYFLRYKRVAILVVTIQKHPSFSRESSS